nr:hypothetical protein [Tanacetum cinerariifolium]
GNSLLYHEELSILRGRKSVPGMNSRERGNEKKRTTLSSRADDGSFKVTPFKVPDLNVKLDFKIDLIVFGPDIRSAPSSFFNGGSRMLQTKDSSAESYLVFKEFVTIDEGSVTFI